VAPPESGDDRVNSDSDDGKGRGGAAGSTITHGTPGPTSKLRNQLEEHQVKIRNIMAIATLPLTVTALALTASSAAAIGAKDYQAALSGAGYAVSVEPSPVTHAGLKRPGTMIKIDKGGKGATLELIDYSGDRDALKTDWITENGAGPRPRIATNDFAGRVLYWNDDSVLAVDFREPNFREAAQAAGEVFLGRRGTGGPTTGANGSVTGMKLPATGTGGSSKQVGPGDILLSVALLGAGGLLLMACLGAIVRRRRD
jgi:hypothetical protein